MEYTSFTASYIPAWEQNNILPQCTVYHTKILQQKVTGCQSTDTEDQNTPPHKIWCHHNTLAEDNYMEEKPTDVTISILFVYCRISTCFGPTGPSSGEFTQLFTQPLVQCLYCSGHVLCLLWQHTEHATRAVQILNQWLCELLCELSWRWACGPETCRDPAIYE